MNLEEIKSEIQKAQQKILFQLKTDRSPFVEFEHFVYNGLNFPIAFSNITGRIFIYYKSKKDNEDGPYSSVVIDKEYFKDTDKWIIQYEENIKKEKLKQELSHLNMLNEYLIEIGK